MNVYKHLLSALSKCNTRYISIITAVRFIAIQQSRFNKQHVDLSLVDKMWTKIWVGGQQSLSLLRS